jgi:hypothetical protein
MWRDLERAADLCVLHCQQRVHVVDRQQPTRMVKRNRIADPQQPHQHGERVAIIAERETCRRLLVSSERGQRWRTDSFADPVNRVRRTAQRVRDSLRRRLCQ